jgi:ComF family protein
LGIQAKSCNEMRIRRYSSAGEFPRGAFDDRFIFTVMTKRSRAIVGCKALIRRGLESLLPRHCVLCGLASGGANLCPYCASDLPRIRHGCDLCGLPTGTGGDCICGACLSRPPPWDRAKAALLYEFPADQFIVRFKFSRDLACGQVLGTELSRTLQRAALDPPDRIVPVPLGRGRQLRRGFNQAEWLARQVGRDLAIPCATDLLLRRRGTAPQSGLDAQDRRRNLRGAFQVSAAGSRRPLPRHIALLDDVMTTGATLAECTKVLKRAGVRRISIWVAAVTPAVR